MASTAIALASTGSYGCSHHSSGAKDRTLDGKDDISDDEITDTAGEDDELIEEDDVSEDAEEENINTDDDPRK